MLHIKTRQNVDEKHGRNIITYTEMCLYCCTRYELGQIGLHTCNFAIEWMIEQMQHKLEERHWYSLLFIIGTGNEHKIDAVKTLIRDFTATFKPKHIIKWMRDNHIVWLSVKPLLSLLESNRREVRKLGSFSSRVLSRTEWSDKLLKNEGFESEVLSTTKRISAKQKERIRGPHRNGDESGGYNHNQGGGRKRQRPKSAHYFARKSKIEDNPQRKRSSSGDKNKHVSRVSEDVPRRRATALEKSEHWFTGWLIDHSKLRLVCELGKGAFGTVYRGTYRHTGVAIKVCQTKKEAKLQSFLREINVMLKLRPHCNVVQIYGVCIHKKRPFMVLEYIDGGSLLDLICDKTNEFPDEQKRAILLDVSVGMEHLHAAGIVHRDLAARNILVRKGGELIF
mmetsp:Transcript_19259/g.21437  ORF Transcript_19259/g.21437 Transcript_19259/m.21437 type:complete len:394 (-) Transcript_19259:458-1639(-)